MVARKVAGSNTRSFLVAATVGMIGTLSGF
jgi:hypothetical protein